MSQQEQTLNHHKIANLFPMMQENEYQGLKQDIQANGLIEPIVLLDGLILDGRNRYKSCQELNLKPEFKDYTGDNPVNYVVSQNLHRRHLNSSQKAFIALNAKKLYSAKAKERQGARTDLDNISQRIDEGGRANEQAAKKYQTNRQYISDAELIREKAPDLEQEIMNGKITLPKAKAKIKKDENNIKVKRLKEREIGKPDGLYDVIIIDPPWEIKKIIRDVRPNQVGFDYPTMNVDEIKNISLPVNGDCHIWLWTTHKYLPVAFKCLDSWNARYVCTFVWHKNGGYQPIGLPQYNCEFVLYARIGMPKFIDTKAFNTAFSALRGKHSEKPQEFYDVVKRVTAGRRLDMFNRREINGFDGWGNEVELAG